MAKVKGKEWYEVFAPKEFGGKFIGSSMASDPKLLTGRRIEVSVPELTGNYRKFYLKARFEMVKAEGEKVLSEFYSLEVLRDYISRAVRRRTTKIELVQNLKSADGKDFVMKTIAVTLRKPTQIVVSELRRKLSEEIKESAEKVKLSDLVYDVMVGKFEGTMSKGVEKVYPLRTVIVRKIQVLK